jgi:hypothetical protein
VHVIFFLKILHVLVGSILSEYPAREICCDAESHHSIILDTRSNLNILKRIDF